MIKLHNDLLIIIDALTEQIELFEWTKKDLEKRMNANKPKDIKAMAFDSEIRGCRDFTTIDRLAPIYNQIKRNLEEYEIELEGLKAQVDKVQCDMGKLEGLQSKIYKLHVVDGLTLQQISEELYISKRQVERVNSSIGKILNNDR